MAGGVISTGTHPKALWPGIHAWWGQLYNKHQKEYSDLYTVLTSDKAYEQDVEVTGFALAPVKTEGDSMSYDSEQQGWVTTYTHIAYALGYIVTFEERRDNLYEVISRRRAQANAFSINQTIENVAAGLFNDAFTGNVFQFPDGSTLCGVHTTSTGSTFSNALPQGADLTEAALEDISIQAAGFMTDRGLLINVMPESLHIPRQEMFNATRILKSIQQSGTANNDVNALRVMGMFPKGVMMNHYFTSPYAWFVRTNCPNGTQMFWRDEPEFDQDNDYDTKNAKAGTYMRFSVGCTDPRGLLGSNGP